MTKGEDILLGELFGRPKVLPVRFFAEISEEPGEVVGQVSPDCGTEPFAKQFLGNHRHFQLVQLGVHDGHDEAFESRILLTVKAPLGAFETLAPLTEGGARFVGYYLTRTGGCSCEEQSALLFAVGDGRCAGLGFTKIDPLLAGALGIGSDDAAGDDAVAGFNCVFAERTTDALNSIGKFYVCHK